MPPGGSSTWGRRTMAADSLPLADVFILTFNAQKEIINVPVFAKHLLDVFRDNGAASASAAVAALPDLVVFSLQEMAPLAKAFAGSTMLGPYLDAYGEALNRAAARFAAEDMTDGSSSSSSARAVVKKPFSLIATRNVGMTASMLFARDAAAVGKVQAAEVGFGAGDMANKGAVGLRVLYTDEEGKGGTGGTQRSTELTFVTTHLAAMEWNLSKRNKNWESLVSGLVFEDPKKYADRASARSRDRSTVQGGGDEAEGLLSEEQTEMEKAMHNLSIYKPGSHLFVAGDLNYRISSTSPEDDAIFPSTDPQSPDHYPRFLKLDQLTQERLAGRTMHGLSEAKISFPPTYKLKVLPKDEESSGTAEQRTTGDDGDDLFEEDKVAWKWAPHRWPGWCDRVLYRDIPQGKMQVVDYNCLPPMRTSDHRPVYLRIQVPVIEPEQLSQIPDAIEDETGTVDTRKKLPFEIDVDSWQHRAQIKKLESTIGWSLLAAQSKQAIAVLATLLVLGAGAWWYTAMSSVV